jgi:hypothetical protein
MIRRDQLTKALDFLEIHEPHKRASILDCTVRTSVEGLGYMHRIRFSVSKQYNTFDTDNPTATSAKQEKFLRLGRKRKFQKTHKIFAQFISSGND